MNPGGRPIAHLPFPAMVVSVIFLVGVACAARSVAEPTPTAVLPVVPTPTSTPAAARPMAPTPTSTPAPARLLVSQSDAIVGRYGIYELSIQHDDAAYENPWEDVALSARFVDPDGQEISVDGFYYGADQWKLRFTPPAVGRWTWDLEFAASTDTLLVSGSFVVEPSERPGFVRQHPDNPYRLIFEDGSLFIPLGIGDCIRDDNRNGSLDEWGLDGEIRPAGRHEGWTVDMQSYMSTYGASGAGFNLFRWSVDNCAFKLWNAISPEGNRYLVREGLFGDQLVKALRDNGFRIWMTIFSFEPPFLQAAGDSPEMEAVRRYIRYVVARWGAYVDIWELANEARLPESWITFTSDYLRSIDPYDRLITTSLERPELAAIDINAPHWYERESELESDLRASHRILEAKKWGKPVIFGEQGNQVANWDEGSGRRMRIRSWTAFFEEAALVFWNSSFAKDYRTAHGAANLYIGPEERGYVRVLQLFARNADAQSVQLALAPADDGVRAYGLVSANALLGYFHHFADHDAEVTTGVTLELPGAGTALWMDPATGDTLDSYAVRPGVQTLSTPPFAVDLALRILLEAPAGAY